MTYMFISSFVKMERFMLIELHFSEEDNESNYVYKCLEPFFGSFHGRSFDAFSKVFLLDFFYDSNEIKFYVCNLKIL